MTTPAIEERMARLEGAYEQSNLRLGRLEEETRALRVEIREGLNSLKAELNARLDRLEDRLDGRMDRLEGRMDRLDGKMDRLFYATMALLGGIIAAIVAVILTRLL